MPSFGPSFSRCINPCWRSASLAATSARITCMPAVNETTGNRAGCCAFAVVPAVRRNRTRVAGNRGRAVMGGESVCVGRQSLSYKKQKRQDWPAFFAKLDANYFAAAAFLAFLDFFLVALAFGAGASADAAGAAAGAAGVAGAAAWLAAKEAEANKPATRAAISFFIFYPSISEVR